MLVSMSEIDPRADAPLVDWSDLGVSGLLPTGFLVNLNRTVLTWWRNAEAAHRPMCTPLEWIWCLSWCAVRVSNPGPAD
jgi:hypothetical protein